MWGTGRIDGQRVAIGLFDFHFMGGSMGSVVGEKMARCFEAALTERIPAIVVTASGGARMQEGTLSLLQLAKTTAPLARMDTAGVPFISVLTDPTTGGVLASFASLGDVIVAEPRALIGFAGARVASGTVGEELPEGFQSAEFLLEHGFVDLVVPRSELRATLTRLLRVLPPAPAEEAWAQGEQRGWGPIGVLSGLAERVGGAVSETIGIEVEAQPAADTNGDAPRTSVAKREAEERAMTEMLPPTLEAIANAEPDQAAIDAAWRRVQLARHPQRPRTLDLVPRIFDGFVELHGDRSFRDDPAIVGGPALLEGRPVMVIGHQKGNDTESNILRNFGSPHPEGFRKAQRLMRLAEKLGMPVITFLDTAGAFPGPAAEERGQAEAIATSIKLMTGLQVPIVVVVLGEGGSGGALAIGVGDVVLALENAVYSVISPEGCASILWRDPEKAPVAAAAMRMTAADQLELGVIDAIIDEPKEGAQHDPAATARSVRRRSSATCSASAESNRRRCSRAGMLVCAPSGSSSRRRATAPRCWSRHAARAHRAPAADPRRAQRRAGARSGRVARTTARTRVTNDRSRRRARADRAGRQRSSYPS